VNWKGVFLEVPKELNSVLGGSSGGNPDGTGFGGTPPSPKELHAIVNGIETAAGWVYGSVKGFLG